MHNFQGSSDPKDQKTESDICLILEGTYPYIAGGVSSWVHQLILNQSDVTFSLVCILAPKAMMNSQYTLPDNVIEVKHITLQSLPKIIKRKKKIFRGTPKCLISKEAFFEGLYDPLQEIVSGTATTESLQSIINLLQNVDIPLDMKNLLESKDGWSLIEKMYNESYSHLSFLNFYWTWRGILSGFYSVLLAEIPVAKVYHSPCTGYAGLLLAVAHLKTERPILLTEHGVYTNERRIELATTDWLKESYMASMNIFEQAKKEIKSLWMNCFSSFSHLSYAASSEIITLYQGNYALQIEDGAAKHKLKVIPNGIDLDKFANIEKMVDEPPTIALIGRVVLIKGVKTFIQSMHEVVQNIPNLRAWVMGPIDEDEDYFKECEELVRYLGLQDTLTFTGMVNIQDYLPKIDIVMLSSLSEAQPLVILEAGASGIVPVTTDVGACREMIEGKSDEFPQLGKGGAVCALSDAKELAAAATQLLQDPILYQSCSTAMKYRIAKYYDAKEQHLAYHNLYQHYMMVGK